MSKLTKVTTIVLVAILMMTSTTSTASELGNVSFPNLITAEQTIQANEKNDFYVKGSPFFDAFNHEFRFNGSGMDRTDYFEDTIDPVATYGARQSFQGAGQGIMQFLNTTAEGNELSFNTKLYDLLNARTVFLGDEEGNVSQIENIAMYAGESYGFSLEITDLSPIHLAFLFNQIDGSSTLGLDLSIIGPDGNFDTQFNNVVTRNVLELVPIVPSEMGTYYVIISVDTDAVLNSIYLDTDPEMHPIETGISEQLTGTQTTGKFILLNSTELEMWDIHTLVYESLYYGSFPYLGTIDIRIFDDPQAPLGAGFNGGLQVSSSDIVISVIASPPDDSDPNIKQIKEHQGLPEGFDVEYNIFVEKYSIDPLPELNSVFETPFSVSYSGDIRYSFETDENILLGVNSTGTVTTQFVDIETGDTYALSTANNDILNSVNDQPLFLPEGQYYIEMPLYEEIQITEMKLSDLPTLPVSDTTNDVEIDLVLNQPVYYYLPSDGFVVDYLNFTYTSQLNQSIDVDLDIYDLEGNFVDSSPTMTFEHYYYTQGNNIQGPVTNLNDNFEVTDPNFDGTVMKIYMSSNALYDAEQVNNNNPLYTDNVTLTDSISVTRFNSLDLEEQNDPSIVNSITTLSDSDQYSLSELNTSITYYFSYDTDNDSIYRIQFDTINRTIANFQSLFVDGGWNIPFTEFTYIDQNNITHNVFEIEFATTDIIDFTFIVEMSNEALNDTLNISVENLSAVELDIPDVTLLNDNPLNPELETGDRQVNVWPYVGIAGGVAAIGGVIALLWQRPEFFTNILNKIRGGDDQF